MVSGETDGGDVAGRFAAALADLKRRGCSLLVVGRDSSAQDVACTRLLGENGSDSRRRLLVLTDRNVDAHPGARRLSAGPGGSDSVIAYRQAVRSAAASQSSMTSTVTPTSVSGDLSDLQSSILAEIDAAGDAFEPGEFRLCLDTLGPVLEAHGERSTFEFLHAIRGTMRDVTGMAHVHLQAEYDDETVATLAPLFDAVVEVRAGREQRWHLKEPSLTTDWLTL